MARDQELVRCPPGVWTELTNSDATTVTFLVVSGAIKVRATTGASPASTDPGYTYAAKSYDEQATGELRIPIADMSSAAGADRLWARPINGRSAAVVVDHV